jgi:alanyl-tRNA synthetase
VTDIRKERLYYDQSELYEFEATVVEEVQQQGKLLVRLDKTAFYPTSGGQPNDTGWLGAARVLDVLVMDEHVYHVVDLPCPIGEKVLGRIDVPRRVDHMQQHAGQHIVSACFEQLFDIDTVGFHLGDEFVTIDLDTSLLTMETFQAVEEKANQIVLEDRKIMPVFVSSEDLPSLKLRHAPRVAQNIRIVGIEGFDNNPCGGTHPSSTGKVGQIKLLKTEKARNGIRLWFVCGGRALKEHEKSLTLLQQLGKVFSTGREGLVEAVERQLASLHEQKKLNVEIANRLSCMEGKELYTYSEVMGDKSLFCCSMIQSAPDASYLKSVVKAYEAEAGSKAFMLVLIAPIGNRMFIQAACAGSVQFGANEWIMPVIKEFGGKGGGNGTLAQGSVPIPAQGATGQIAEKLIDCLKSIIVRR